MLTKPWIYDEGGASVVLKCRPFFTAGQTRDLSTSQLGLLKVQGSYFISMFKGEHCAN
jgi:hypothetical protein